MVEEGSSDGYLSEVEEIMGLVLTCLEAKIPDTITDTYLDNNNNDNDDERDGRELHGNLVASGCNKQMIPGKITSLKK